VARAVGSIDEPPQRGHDVVAGKFTVLHAAHRLAASAGSPPDRVQSVAEVGEPVEPVVAGEIITQTI
jgi:hypothetical protein